MDVIAQIIIAVIIRGPGWLILTILGEDEDQEALGCILSLVFWGIVIAGLVLIAKLSNLARY